MFGTPSKSGHRTPLSFSFVWYDTVDHVILRAILCILFQLSVFWANELWYSFFRVVESFAIFSDVCGIVCTTTLRVKNCRFWWLLIIYLENPTFIYTISLTTSTESLTSPLESSTCTDTHTFPLTIQYSRSQWIRTLTVYISSASLWYRTLLICFNDGIHDFEHSQRTSNYCGIPKFHWHWMITIKFEFMFTCRDLVGNSDGFGDGLLKVWWQIHIITCPIRSRVHHVRLWNDRMVLCFGWMSICVEFYVLHLYPHPWGRDDPSESLRIFEILLDKDPTDGNVANEVQDVNGRPDVKRTNISTSSARSNPAFIERRDMGSQALRNSIRFKDGRYSRVKVVGYDRYCSSQKYESGSRSTGISTSLTRRKILGKIMVWIILILFFQTRILLVRKLCCIFLKPTKQWSRWS